MRSLEGKKLLVTGANGFMGSTLTRRLLSEKAAEIHAFVFGEFELIKDLEGQVQIHDVNLSDAAAVKTAIDSIKPDFVFNLAAMVNVQRDIKLSAKLFEVNLHGPMNLLTALSDHGFESFVQIGTCEEYGDNPTPFTEDQMPTAVSPYSASKVAATYYCRMLAKTQNLPIVVCRPFLTYGPGLRNRMLTTSLIKSGLAGETLEMTPCEQTREFNYVEDIVEGFILASKHPEADGEIINIGCGEEIQLRKFVEMVSELLDGKLKVEFGALPYRPGETWHFYCSNEKAKKLLGYEPKVDLREGLRRTIEWYRQHPEILENL